jgi:hypothetical protein
MRSPKQNIAADVAALKEHLNSVIATLAALANAAGGKERSSWTLREFQHRHNLSESQYHKLRREGRAPRTMRTGAVGVRISRDAERDWILQREREAVGAGLSEIADG